MLNIFQELVPFSNKRLEKSISTNATFTNPVIMSWAFDFTICSNTLETVIYVRNDLSTDCYTNVIISLQKEDKSITNPVIANGVIDKFASNSSPSYSINGYLAPLGFSTETIPNIQQPIIIPGAYNSNYIPILSDKNPDTNALIETDDSLSVKFSYGYDEISAVDWISKNSILCITNIGTKGTVLNRLGMPDTSYHPIRMRITWKKQATLLTIRDYFIDVSYEKMEKI